MLDLSDRITRSPSAASERAASDQLILDLETGEYFSVGEVGGFIWERLDGTRSLASIANEIADSFGVEAEAAAADVLAFVGSLLASSLVESPAGP